MQFVIQDNIDLAKPKSGTRTFFSCTSQGHNALPWLGLEPGWSDLEPSALTTGLLNEAMALACPWYSWPRMLKVAPCMVVQSCGHTSKFFWLDGLLVFCLIMGLRSASCVINLNPKEIRTFIRVSPTHICCGGWSLDHTRGSGLRCSQVFVSCLVGSSQLGPSTDFIILSLALDTTTTSLSFWLSYVHTLTIIFTSFIQWSCCGKQKNSD